MIKLSTESIQKHARNIFADNEIFYGIVHMIENQDHDALSTGNVQYKQTMSIVNTGAMKGRKPITVIIGGETITCTTWKKVVEVIIRKCNDIPEMHDRLLELRNQFLGRSRKILSDNKNHMRSPLEIDKELFFEAHYDTQSLLNLMLRLLAAVDYDYTSIKVTVRS